MTVLSGMRSNEAAIMQVAANPRKITATTAGAETLAVGDFVDGYVKQTGAQALHNKTTPTAAAIVAAISNARVGFAFEFILANPGGGAAITLVAGTGVTLQGTASVAAAASRVWKGVLTNVTAGAEAVEMISAA